MYIVKKNDRTDFAEVFVVKIFYCCCKFIGVGVFAVNGNNDLFTFLNIIINVAFNVITGIGNLAHFSEIVVVPHIKKFGKFSIVIKYVAFISGNPVHINLIRIIGHVAVKKFCSGFYSLIFKPVFHNKQLFNIIPVYPQRKKAFTVVYSVGNKSVYFNYMLIKLVVRTFYKTDSVCGKLFHAVLRNKI